MSPLPHEGRFLEAAHPDQMCSLAKPPNSTTQQPLFGLPTAVRSDRSYAVDDRLVMRSTATLQQHPSLHKLKLVPSEERLLPLEKCGEAIFEQPVLITHENLIVDGYARWFLARRQHRETLRCFTSQLSQQDALRRILQNQIPQRRLNGYCRIMLALDLEPWFRDRARANQIAGGKWKGSSNLTDDRRLDCCKEIAVAAGVSTGNVTKVKQLLRSRVADEVMEAIRSNEISIHWAWMLCKLPVADQQSTLKKRRSAKRSSQRIRKLLSKNIPISHQIAESLRHLRLGVAGLKNVPSMDGLLNRIDDAITTFEHELPTDRSDTDAHQTDHSANTDRQSEILRQSTNQASGPRQLLESASLQNPGSRG